MNMKPNEQVMSLRDMSLQLNRPGNGALTEKKRRIFRTLK